jgi:hypothetical protein
VRVPQEDCQRRRGSYVLFYLCGFALEHNCYTIRGMPAIQLPSISYAAQGWMTARAQMRVTILTTFRQLRRAETCAEDMQTAANDDGG